MCLFVTVYLCVEVSNYNCVRLKYMHVRTEGAVSHGRTHTNY